MSTRSVKMGGLKRIYSKEYKVEDDTYKCKEGFPMGRIVISSRKLKDYAGKIVRIVVYTKRKNGK